MADKLNFSLICPECELFSGEVDQVDIPGTEGDMGIFPKHSPVMSAVRTGLVTIYNDGTEDLYFVSGGFADVTPMGLTLLADEATHIDEVDHEDLKNRIAEAESHLETLQGHHALSMQQDLDGMRAVLHLK